ncbi:MAG TPA: non-canonical purine NTP pyrophosphatase, partial [Prevotella sp.]|nr:non-canonical purine NTP pyrophosphatase [Prevotella sp.]
TNNQHKLQEIREILGDQFEILSLSDIGCHEDIPETGNTLEANAHQKAEYVFDHYHIDCFADDTGLEVDALGGAPGVHSARYADGTDHDSEANMNKLLTKLGDNENRKARFRTVISLIQMEGGNPVCSREYRFEGTVEGRIAHEKHGTEGFGYDPIFIPDGYDKSFAELGEEVKNKISHRAKAVKKLAEWLLSE